MACCHFSFDAFGSRDRKASRHLDHFGEHPPWQKDAEPPPQALHISHQLTTGLPAAGQIACNIFFLTLEPHGELLRGRAV